MIPTIKTIKTKEERWVTIAKSACRSVLLWLRQRLTASTESTKNGVPALGESIFVFSFLYKSGSEQKLLSQLKLIAQSVKNRRVLLHCANKREKKVLIVAIIARRN